jgi:predicted nucleotidyltransferase
MKKIYLVLLISLFTTITVGQIAFEQIHPLNQPNFSNFVGVDRGSIAFADVDNDNDQDVFITGSNNLGRIAKLYTNDGNGFFTVVNDTPFEGVLLSSIAFADVDNDSDQDVLICGKNSSGQQIAKLYTNDGNGVFTEVAETPFEEVWRGSLAFADIDNDNDLDVLITGSNSNNQRVAKLYTNDGSGTFTEVAETPFEGVRDGAIAFADVDNDSDQDVLITGSSSSNQGVAKLYTNDGNGIFTEVAETPFEKVTRSSISFADIDNDNDKDVLITGRNNSFVYISKLYTNDGSGSYTEATGTPFDGVNSGSISFADIDNDSDQDVLITGKNNSFVYISKLYTNDGSGSYTEATGTPFDGVGYGSIAFADVDNDNDFDLLITGNNSSDQKIVKLYTNDGNGEFTEVKESVFEGVNPTSIAFADIDNDSDQDVLIAGRNNSPIYITKLYTNDGNGNYTEVLGTPFEGVAAYSVAFADIDNDQDQDLLITGIIDDDQRISKLYINDGNGVFTELTETPFEGVWFSSIAFADIDNDSDQDVLIVGSNNSFQIIAKLYNNDGNGNYIEVMGTPFDGVLWGSIDFTDIDNDNDQDVLITGRDSSSERITKLYSNNGNGVFTEITETPFEGVESATVEFADIDNDNDQDVLITGRTTASPPLQPITKLYSNNGTGVFTELTETPFDAVDLGTAAFADVDNDNDLDVLSTGFGFTKLYVNDGSGVFTEFTETLFGNVKARSIAFADIDNDNDQDVLIIGGSTNLYRNISIVGINESIILSQVIIYPNPFTTKFSFNYKGNDPSALIAIYDLLGREVYSLRIFNGLNTIQLGDITGSTFILKLTDKSGTSTQKIIRKP